MTNFKPRFLLIICLLTCLNATAQPDPPSFHSLSIKTANGGEIMFSAFAGKKILLVNTASLDPGNAQISQLQTLAGQNAGKLVVIALPCSDFNNLEPEPDNAKIFQRYSQQFGVSFPVTIKVTAIPGAGMHPVYQWLTRKENNGLSNSRVKKNFQKYLINEQGRICGLFDGSVSPLNPVIQAAIDGN